MTTFDNDVFLEHIKTHPNESKIDIAKWAWGCRQAEIDALKVQLNNMEQCYIEKKKQVEAVEHILGCAMIGPKQLFTYAGEIRKALNNPQYPMER